MLLFKKIWNIFTSILVAIVILLAILLAGVKLVGFQSFAVLSGSMEPTYHVGSLIYVKKVDFHLLHVGDPITYLLDEDTIVTHRIVEVLHDSSDPDVIRFRTKGDSNKDADGGAIHCKNVIGKPVFSIPALGYVANYIQHPPGTYVAIMVGALLLFLVFLPDFFQKSDQDTQAGKDNSDNKAIKAKPVKAKPVKAKPVKVNFVSSNFPNIPNIPNNPIVPNIPNNPIVPNIPNNPNIPNFTGAPTAYSVNSYTSEDRHSSPLFPSLSASTPRVPGLGSDVTASSLGAFAPYEGADATTHSSLYSRTNASPFRSPPSLKSSRATSSRSSRAHRSPEFDDD